MISNSNLEDIIKRRITNKELYIKKITTKYLELLAMLQTNEHNDKQLNEKTTILNDILVELENLEILIKKSNIIKNTQMTQDKQYNTSKLESIESMIKLKEEEITNNKQSYKIILKNKSDKLECEEIAYEINQYADIDNLKETIETLYKNKESIEIELKEVDKKINYKSKQISLIMKVINEMRNDEI